MSNCCPNCGYQLEDEAVFCINCGARLDGQPDTRPSQTVQQPDYQAEMLNRYYQSQPEKKSRTGLIVGLIIGGVILLFVLLGVFVIFIMPGIIVSPGNTDRPTETYAEGYYPAADYRDIDWNSLDYGDENTMKDFSYTDGWSSMSPSAKRITDFDSVVGFWKGVMVTDPENETEEGKSFDYFNVEISGSADDTFAIINWDRRVIEKTGEKLELRGSQGGFSGTFTNGSLKAENGNIIELTDFYSDGGKEYAVGKFIWTGGSTGYIGLVRDKGE